MIAALLAYALAATLIIIVPGPGSLLVMRNTLRRGRRGGWTTVAHAAATNLRISTPHTQGNARCAEADPPHRVSPPE